jgi:hypothetical protein
MLANMNSPFVASHACMCVFALRVRVFLHRVLEDEHLVRSSSGRSCSLPPEYAVSEAPMWIK